GPRCGSCRRGPRAATRLRTSPCHPAEVERNRTTPVPDLPTTRSSTMVRIPKSFVVLLAVALMLAFAGVALADEAKGTFQAAAGKDVVVTVGGKDATFVMGDTCKVTIGGAAGKVTDLKKGDEVTVTYQKQGDKLVASEIAKK